MPDSSTSPFLELVSRRFAACDRAELEAAFARALDEAGSEAEYDLALWSLAQRLRVDSEELLRQLGEAWLAERDAWASAAPDLFSALLQLVADPDGLRRAPVFGMDRFSVTALSQSPDSLRARCEGARRCCSFLEGVARAMGERRGVSLRYLRQPKRANVVEIAFSAFPR